MKFSFDASRAKKPWMVTAVLVSGLFAMSVQAESTHAIVKVPAGVKAPADLATQVSAWRKSGAVSDALWVDSTQKEKAGFSSVLALEFPDDAAYRRWAAANAKILAAPLTVKPADVLAHGEVAPRDSTQSVFKVSYYLPTSSRPEVVQWVDGYLAKYLLAQMAGGILVNYTMYLERDGSEKGQLLLVLQYRDAKIAAAAEPIKGKMNDDLAASDPVYASLMDAKERVRITQSVTNGKFVAPATR